MDLYRSIEGLLKRNNGTVSFDEAYEFLENDYSEKTIKEFLDRNRKYFHFDGAVISSYQVKIDLFLAALKALVLKFRPGTDNLKNTVLSTLFKHLDLSSDNDVFFKGTAEQLDEGFFLVDVEDDLIWDSEFFSTPEKKYLFTSQLFEFLLNEEFGGYGLFSTPHTLTELFTELLPDRQKINLYNPTAGFLNLVAGLSVYSGFDIKIKASEINKTIYEYGKLFAAINKLNINYSCIDSCVEVMDLTPHYYDAIVGNLPFSLKEKSYYRENRRFAETSLHIIYESLGKLTGNSRAIFLINDGILFSQAKEKIEFRKEIIDSGLLKAIIALPSKILPQSPVNISLLIFEKGRKNDKVQFIDASSEFLSYLNPDKSVSLKADKIATLINRENEGDKYEVNEPAANYGNEGVEFIIPVTEIQVHDYDLSAGRYKASKELTGKEYTELKTVIKVKQTQTVKENSRFPFIRISDLNGKLIEGNSNLSYNTTLSKGKHLNEPAILIGKVGNSYKPTWFTGEFDVEISNNIVAFDYDEEKVFPPYFVQELNADYVHRQLNLLSKGSAMKYITVDNILSVRIKLLPVEEQIKLASDRSSYAEAHILQDKKDKTTISDSDIYQVFRHEIGNILQGPEGFLKQLPAVLERHQIGLNVPVINNQPETIGDSINASINGIQQIHWILENMKGVLLSDKQYFKPEFTELKPFFEECLKNEIINEDLKWYVIIKDQHSSHAEIDRYQFKHVVRNMVSNAIRHGKAGKPVSLIVYIWDYSDLLPEDDDSVYIEFINDGNPLPADFTINDYIRFGSKAGSSKGQGLGGYLIHRIVQNHNGTIDIEPLFNDIKPAEDILIRNNVCFRINISKKQ